MKKVVALPQVQPRSAVQSQTVARETASSGERIGIGRIAKRLTVYEGRLYQWRAVTEQLRSAAMNGGEPLPNGWEACLQRLENTYGDYDRLRRRIVTGAEHDEDAISSWEVIEEDFAYQESGCMALFRERSASMDAGRSSTVDLESIGNQICEAVRQGK
ncbi:MAG: hypothetical protein OEL66_10760, partial [Desulfobulbaceae bacterium]|nr:hypothetical protein [Desulfobulbaceae bacterium]